MPRYPYHCKACGWRGERTAPASQRHIVCPDCHRDLSPLITAPSLASDRATEGKGKP